MYPVAFTCLSSTRRTAPTWETCARHRCTDGAAMARTCCAPRSVSPVSRPTPSSTCTSGALCLSSSSFHRHFDMYEVGCHGAALCCASPAACHTPPSAFTSGTLLISRIEPLLLCQSDVPAAQMRPSRAAAALNSVPICSTSLADGNHCAGRSFGACRCLTSSGMRALGTACTALGGTGVETGVMRLVSSCDAVGVQLLGSAGQCQLEIKPSRNVPSAAA